MGKGEGKGDGQGKGGGGFIGGCYHDLLGFGRHVLGCVCCLLCTGPILLIVGVVLLASATHDGRTELISQYNNAVTAWNAERPNFEGAVFQYSSGGFSTKMGEMNTDPALKDSDLSKVSTYTPLKYVTQTTPVGLQEAYINGGSIGTYATTYTLPYSGLTGNCDPTTLSGTNSCYNVCYNAGGTWYPNGRVCTFPIVPVVACVVVSKVNGIYQPFPTNGKSGCYPCALNSLSNYVCSDYDIIQYRIGTASGNYDIQPTVRDSLDPYVILARLTSGSMNFGLSTKQKLATGAALIAIGGALVFVVYGGLYSFVKCMKRRQGGTSYQVVGNTGYQNAPPAPGYGGQQYGAAPSYA